MLDEQEVKQVKEQLLKQVEGFPEEQREAAKEQILSMSDDELEEFLEKNNLVKKSGKSACVFCSIVKNEIPSYKIDENKNAIAVLDINPLSKAHSLVIPRKHEPIEKLPASVLSLARKTAKKIKSKFKPEEIKIETSKIQGHGIINIVPLYENEKLEKKKFSQEEMQEIQKKLDFQKRTSRKAGKEKQKPSFKEIKLEKAPVRIP